MDENCEIVYLETPETSRYVSGVQSTATQYLLYSTSTSLVPSSLDQIMKNHALIVDGDPLNCTR